MRILVTGRNGQVARSLAERAGPDHELIFAARPELDLAMPASIEQIVRKISPDLIVSAAAYTAVDAAEDDRFNELLIALALAPRSVVLFRALFRYLRQTGVSYGLVTMVETLLRQPEIARAIKIGQRRRPRLGDAAQL